MSKLALPNLVIDNFRLFKHLEIERLGRLNLITGANGSGKTCLLEAVELWASRGWFWTAVQQSRRRLWPIELPSDPVAERGGLDDVLAAASAVFVGWPRLLDTDASASISGDGSTLQFGVGWSEEGRRPNEGVAASDIAVAPQWWASFPDPPRAHSFQRLDLRGRSGRRPAQIPAAYVPAGGYEPKEFAEIWDRAALTPTGDAVEAALSRLHPGTGRVNCVEDPALGSRVPVVILDGAPRAVTLPLLGGGAVRLLELGYPMVDATGGVLLIDEFENGLHRTVQEQVWELVLSLARELNVQVFATTHSWDCVEAFQAITADHPDEEAYLLRLDRLADRIRVTEFDRRRMAIATESAIEVR